VTGEAGTVHDGAFDESAIRRPARRPQTSVTHDHEDEGLSPRLGKNNHRTHREGCKSWFVT
jgi:hypothetical protein